MCGRFTLKRPRRIRFDTAGDAGFIDLLPRYNIAPSQEIVAIVENGDQYARLFQWGLIPSWSKEPKAIINARSETLVEKPSFRDSFQRRRCLIPADGFYEWERKGKFIQPYYFQMRDHSPFCFAGIWDTWQFGEKTINSCAIITTSANEVLAPIHDRMPVILPPGDYESWLQPSSRPDYLLSLLEPFPADAMTSHPVSSKVNGAEADGSELVEEVEIKEVPVNGRLFD